MGYTFFGQGYWHADNSGTWVKRFFQVHVPFNDIITRKSELPDIWYYRTKRNVKLLSFFIIEGLIFSNNCKTVLKTKETGRFGITLDSRK